MSRLRRETRHFKTHAINSLILSIEMFNRPHSLLRSEAVLFFLQHAFEMLLKAAIFQTRGKVCDTGSSVTYRFDKCLGIARGELGAITEDEIKTLSILDSLRDCAMHHLLMLSEEGLYLQAQAGVTIFNTILERVFQENLSYYLPERVLPISTNPPKEMQLFIDNEFTSIKELIAPGKRQRAEAKARIRPYLIMESVLEGEASQPSEYKTNRALSRIRSDENWRAIFPSVSTLKLDTSGHGLTFSVRFTRDEKAAPVYIVREGEDLTGATAVREVNLLDRYSMGITQIADKIGLGRNKTLALIMHVGIQEDPDCFKEFRHRTLRYKGYSPKALEKMLEVTHSLSEADIEKIWKNSDLYKRTYCQKRES